MSATKVMVTALLLGVVGRWANNKQAIPSAKGLVETLFALAMISFMDQGKTQPVAKGLAWLFLGAVLLSDDSPLTGLARMQLLPVATSVGTKAGSAAAAAGSAAGKKTATMGKGPKAI